MGREKLGSRLGFILLSAGCAIGCGNVWKFPWMAGQYGGGGFVLIYVLCLVLLGLPVMTMEFALGRAAQASPVKMYQKLKGEDAYKESIHTKGSDGTVTSDETFVYRSHTAYADTTNVLGANAFGFNSYMVFDNVKVSWIEDAVEYPSTGVLYTEDFEDYEKFKSLIEGKLA